MITVFEYLAQKNGNIWSHKNLYTKVHSSFVWNSPHRDATQVSFNRWVVKTGTKEPWNTTQQWKGTDCCKGGNYLNESPGICAEWRKQIPKGYIVSNSIHRTFLNDKTLEMENRLEVTRDERLGRWYEGGGYGDKGPQEGSFWCRNCVVS